VSGHLGLDNYYTTPVMVKLTAMDPDDPPATLTTFYSINNGPFVTGTLLTLTQNGTDTVRFFSVDPAGNRGVTEALTVRIDTTAPVISGLVASPNILWPPNHKTVTVTVTGLVSDASGPLPTSVSYRVLDEYGTVQPSGTAVVAANGTFSFHVPLVSSRLGQDRDGRLYTIQVTAVDQAGNVGQATTRVLVPHDMGHAFNFNQGSPVIALPTTPTSSGGTGSPGHGKGPVHGGGNGHAGNKGHAGNNGHGGGNGHAHVASLRHG
jgi:hypothetical protein